MIYYRLMRLNDIPSLIRPVLSGTGYLTLSKHSFSTGIDQDSFYDILELPQSASKKQIKDAFLRLSKQYHPDTKFDGTTRNEKFIQVCDAYRVLSSPGMKRSYDYNLLKRVNPSLPPRDHPFARYYQDGTIYSGPDNHQTTKRRFTNTQIVIGAVLFSMVGAVLQLTVVRLFSNKRAERTEEMHQDSLAHMHRIRSLSAQGQTQVQLHLADFRTSKSSPVLVTEHEESLLSREDNSDVD